VGDGTTSVVVLAGELLLNCRRLFDFQIHPSAIIAGYYEAARDAIQIVESLCVSQSNDHDALVTVAKSAIATKLTGQWSDVMAQLSVDAVVRIMQNPIGNVNLANQLRVVEMPGAAVDESILVPGVIVL